jgi:hypothetical protein
MNTTLLRTTGLLVLVGVAACSDTTPTTPIRPPLSPSLAASSAGGADENVSVSRGMARMNSRLAAVRSNSRVLKAELLMNGKTWNGVTSTLIIASDRQKGIGAEWVPGDSRRSGRPGVTYAIATERHVRPFTQDPAPFNTGFKLVAHAQLRAQIEEGMAAWRNLSCSSRPIEFARIIGTADKDPDKTDQLIKDLPISANYEKPADIIQSGWRDMQFFRDLAVAFDLPPEAGESILGVTLTYYFVDDKGTATEDDDTLTDVDRNKKADIEVAEVFYNTGFDVTPQGATAFVWSNSGAIAPFLDFYSIITHESGHALGLNHFGKAFITKKDAADDGGPAISEVKYAPYALMNAVYIAGRNEIATLDRSMYCQLWGK